MKKKIIASLLVSLSVVGILPVSAQAAWKKDAYNNNVWVEAGGIKQGWNFIDNFWYYLGADGVPVTGWLQDKGDWYYMWSNGTMAYNTWMTNGGLWYYFDENGKMVTDLVKVESREYDFTNTAIILSKNIGLDNTKNIPQTAEKAVSDTDVSSVVSGEGK